MEPLVKILAKAVPLKQDNLDTDQILPARFLMMPRDEKYKTYLFRDLSHDENQAIISSFILNQEKFSDARILVAGRNFGCGSSREGAVFALVDSGFRCVIAPSFGDIFYNNSFNNGLLPIILEKQHVEELQNELFLDLNPELLVDLENQIVLHKSGFKTTFDIDPHRRERLLRGLDMIGYTQQYLKETEKFEEQYFLSYPWLSIR
ncbi:MAG: 3-isopropylmalate dehydratase small subunit [Rhodospirillaceae bacterium]